MLLRIDECFAAACACRLWGDIWNMLTTGPALPQAFILYEEAVPDSKGEVTALQSIVGTLHRCRVFGPDNRCSAATHDLP